jgi:iron complex outermembrane receptor protein
MFRLFSALGLLLLPLAVVAQIELSGHVLSETTRRPVAGAVIALSGSDRLEVTDESGHFQIEVLPGKQVITIQHLAHKFYVDTLVVQNNLHLDFYLIDRKVALASVTISANRSGQSNGGIVPVQMIPGLAEFTSDVNLHLGAMLRSVPGVSSVNTGVSGGQPWIRGLGGNRVGIFVDGVPQQNQQWAVDHGSDLDPWMADKIRIYKGPSTLRFGPNAAAGAIAIDVPDTLRQSAMQVSAFSRFQSVNDGIEGGFRFRKRWKSLQIEARFTQRAFADYRVPAERFTHLGRTLPIREQRLVNTSGAANAQQVRVRYIKGKHDLRLDVRRSDQLSGIFPGIFGIPSIPALNGDGDRRATQLPRVTSQHQTASLNYERKAGNRALHLIAGVQQARRTEQGPPHAHSNAPTPDDNIALDLGLMAFFSAVHFEQTHANARKTFVGMQAELLDSQSGGWEFLVSDYTSQTAGVYAGIEGITTLWGGRVDGGLRLDAAHTTTRDFSQPVYNELQEIVGSAVLASATNRNFPGWSGSLSWCAPIKKHHQATVQLARSIRFPSPYELAANGVHHGTFRHEQGQAQLNTETGYQLDVRYTGYTGTVEWELSPFVGFYDNFIYLRPAAEFSPLPHAGQLYRFDQSDALRSGAELLVNWNATDALAMSVTGEYVNSYNLNEGVSTPWTPPLKGEASLKWLPLAARGNDLSLSIRYMAVAAQNATDRNEQSTEGYQLLSAGIGATIRPTKAGRIKISAFVNNLFNQQYIDHLSRYKLLNLPEPGRNVGIMILYEFNKPQLTV